jgi:hypothetical protein
LPKVEFDQPLHVAKSINCISTNCKENEVNTTCLCNYASKTNCGVVPDGCDECILKDFLCTSEWDELDLSKTTKMDFASDSSDPKEYRFFIHDSCSAININLEQFSSELYVLFIYQVDVFWLDTFTPTNNKISPYPAANPTYICPGDFGYAPGTWALSYVYALPATGYPFHIDANITLSTQLMESTAAEEPSNVSTT